MFDKSDAGRLACSGMVSATGACRVWIFVILCFLFVDSTGDRVKIKR